MRARPPQPTSSTLGTAISGRAAAAFPARRSLLLLCGAWAGLGCPRKLKSMPGHLWRARKFKCGGPAPHTSRPATCVCVSNHLQAPPGWAPQRAPRVIWPWTKQRHSRPMGHPSARQTTLIWPLAWSQDAMQRAGIRRELRGRRCPAGVVCWALNKSGPHPSSHISQSISQLATGLRTAVCAPSHTLLQPWPPSAAPRARSPS